MKSKTQFKDLSAKSPAELDLILREHASQQLDMRLKRKSGQIEKPHMFKALRREVAQIKTILRAKQA